jgi:hypothetical protein
MTLRPHAERLGLACAMAMIWTAVTGQPHPTLEIVARSEQHKHGVPADIYLIYPDNKEEWLVATDERGVAKMQFSRCRAQYRIVLRPLGDGYFETTDVRCPSAPIRLHFEVQSRGVGPTPSGHRGEPSAKMGVPSANARQASATGPSK